MKKINYFGIIVLLLVLISACISYKSEIDMKIDSAASLSNVKDSTRSNRAEGIAEIKINNNELNQNLNNGFNKHDSIIIYNHIGEASGALFSYGTSGLWSPGRVDEKTAYISNKGSADVLIDKIMLSKFRLYDTNNKEIPKDTREYNDFIDNMRICIADSEKTSYLSNGTFKEAIEKGFAFNDEISISAGRNSKTNFIVSMDEKAGNSLQGLRCQFDIAYFYKVIDIANSSDIVLPKAGSITGGVLLVFIGLAFIFLGIIRISGRRNVRY